MNLITLFLSSVTPAFPFAYLLCIYIERIPYDLPVLPCAKWSYQQKRSLTFLKIKRLNELHKYIFSTRFLAVFICLTVVLFFTYPKFIESFYGVFGVYSPAQLPVGLFIIYLGISTSFIVMSFIDLDHLILPDRFTVGGVILGVTSSMVFPVLQETEFVLTALAKSLLGAVMGFGVLWLLNYLFKIVVKRDSFGFGDVKLLAAFGAFWGSGSVFIIFFLSTLIGSLLGLPTLVRKYIGGESGMSSEIPFGPALCIAGFVFMTWDVFFEKIFRLYALID